jgi:hypothetical protein
METGAHLGFSLGCEGPSRHLVPDEIGTSPTCPPATHIDYETLNFIVNSLYSLHILNMLMADHVQHSAVERDSVINTLRHTSCSK